MILYDNIAPHTLLPSENVLVRKYQVTNHTIRHALALLQQEHIVYTLHGKGSYVAPRSHTRKILIVSGKDSSRIAAERDYGAFFMGALRRSFQIATDCIPAFAEGERLHSQLLTGSKPAGVIFFRNIDDIEKTAAILKEHQIPCLFYGPDIYRKETADLHSWCYDERQAALMLAEAICREGRKKVALHSGTSRLDDIRLNHMLEILPEYNLKAVSRIDRSTDAVCFTSAESVYPVSVELLRENFRIPEKLGLYSFGIPIYPGYSLTAVNVDHFTVGGDCFEAFVRKLDSPDGELLTARASWAILNIVSGEIPK